MNDGNALLPVVRDGATVIRMDQERQSAVAIQRPRDMEAASRNALALLEMDPEEAQNAFYSIPYKSKQNGETVTVYVEGLSVHAAKTLALVWGNCHFTAYVVSEDDEKVVCEGRFLDYQTNVGSTAQWVVSKMFHPRQGNPYRLRADKLQTAIQSGLAKACRNAILGGIPFPVRNRFFAKAREIAVRLVGDGLGKLLGAFDHFGVEREQLETVVGKPCANWTKGDIGRLRGVFNAIKAGESTIDDFLETGPSEEELKAAAAAKVEAEERAKAEEAERLRHELEARREAERQKEARRAAREPQTSQGYPLDENGIPFDPETGQSVDPSTGEVLEALGAGVQKCLACGKPAIGVVGGACPECSEGLFDGQPEPEKAPVPEKSNTCPRCEGRMSADGGCLDPVCVAENQLRLAREKRAQEAAQGEATDETTQTPDPAPNEQGASSGPDSSAETTKSGSGTARGILPGALAGVDEKTRKQLENLRGLTGGAK